MIATKQLSLSLHWSLVVLLMRGKWYKTKMPLNFSLIVIQWGFSSPFLAAHSARVSSTL